MLSLGKTRIVAWLALVFVLTIGAASVGQMSSNSYQIPNNVIDTGGGSQSSAHYKIRDCIGQSSPIGVSQSTRFNVSAGYVYAAFVFHGDANGDGVIDLGDVLYLTNYLYKGGPAPVPLAAGDANCDGVIDIGEVLYLINYLYKGGLPPSCRGASHPNRNCVACDAQHNLQKTAGPAQVGVVSVGTSKDGKKLVEVEGSFETQVGGVQFEFSYDLKEIQRIIPELTDRTKDLNLFFSDERGKLKIGMVDLTGKHLIPAGEGSLVRLAITGSDVSSLALEQAILVDANANHFQVTVLPKEDVKATLPQDFALLQNYPNPFNPETEISYVLPNACHVRLSIYNLLGQRIRTLVDGYQAAGHQTVRWDGTDEQGNKVASGIYFYRIQAGEFTDAKKMILMK